MQAVEVASADHGRRIALAPGQALVLRLPENATTGYRWTVWASGTLVLEDDRAGGTASAPGAGSVHTWRWRAPASGAAAEQRLELACCRAWEPPDKATAFFSLVVAVGP